MKGQVFFLSDLQTGQTRVLEDCYVHPSAGLTDSGLSHTAADGGLSSEVVSSHNPLPP